MIGVRLGVGHHFSGGFDSSASAFFTATGITGTTEQQAVNTLVTSLKSAGLWSKMKAVYPFVTDNRNLLSYTEDFGNAIWVKTNTTITTNSTTAPDGTTTADTFTPTTTNGFHNARALNLTSIVNPYTYSVYAKANGYNYIGLQLASDSSFTNYFEGVFNLSNGTVENTGRASGFTGTRQITSVGNGWYRCTISITNATSSSVFLASITAQSTNDPTTGYAGNGTSGIYVWGAQLELGSTATTYQPIATTQQSYISNQFKYNLVNPVDSDAAFRGVFNGGWTFSNQGATPNGTNGYMDTKFIPSSNLTINDQSYSVYSRSNTAAGAKRELALSSSGEVGVLARYTGDLFYPIIGGGVYPNVSNTDSRGHYIANRTDATNIKGYKNGSLVLTYPQTPNLPTVNTVALSAKNNAGSYTEYSDRQLAFSHLGQGLTDTEATALYNAVNQFQVTLSRNV